MEPSVQTASLEDVQLVQIRTPAAQERDKSAERFVGGWTPGVLGMCSNVKNLHGSYIQVVKGSFGSWTAAFQAPFTATRSFHLGRFGAFGLARLVGLAAPTACSRYFSRC